MYNVTIDFHFVYWFLRKSDHLLKLLKFNAHGFILQTVVRRRFASET